MKRTPANRLALTLVGFWICFWCEYAGGAEAERTTLRVRVADEITRAPIAGATIYARGAGSSGLKKLGVTSTNGVVEFAPLNHDRMIEVRVEAAGYGDRMMLIASDQARPAEIRLYTPEFKFKGFVATAGGQLASGAMIGFAIGDSPLTLEANARVQGGLVDPWHFSSGTVRAEPNGSFAATAPPGTTAIVVVHDLGCGSASTVGWTNGMVIQLRPWASLRGRMLVNGQPAANRTLSAILCSVFNAQARFYLRNFGATTDAEGKFLFDRLPAGVVDVVQRSEVGEVQQFSHWSSFVADLSLPAEEVIYDVVGRNLTGALVDEMGKALDLRGVTFYCRLLVGKSNRAVDEFTPLSGNGAGKPQQYFVLLVDQDGKFSGEAIPAGEYAVQVSCIEGARVARQLEGQAIVPSGEGPLDLGNVVVKHAAR